jgi:hypothetical protein
MPEKPFMELSFIVRDQEVGGSNPLAPTTLFSDLPHTKIRRAPWLETKHLCLTPLGRKRSLLFEFIALQRKVRFTDNPFFEKVGTGSGFWKKNQKARSKPCVLPKCRLVHCQQSSKARASTVVSCEMKVHLRVARITGLLA